MNDFMIILIVTFLFAMTFGALLQKYFKLPWMFSIILFGLVSTTMGWFPNVKQDPIFSGFSNLGQLCLLFTIGLSIDFKEFKKLAKDIFVGNYLTCFAEGFGLSLLFYFFIPNEFSNSYLICLLTGIGFATIGEVILIAILTELKIEKTRFGQLTIGMGVADDILEIIVLTFVSTLPFFYGANGVPITNDPTQIAFKWGTLVLSLFIIGLLTFISVKIGKKSKEFLAKVGKEIPFVTGFLYLTIFLSLIVVGGIFIKEVEVIGAIFAGIICQLLFPEKMMEKLEGNFRFLMMFIGPFFFFMVGYKISLSAIIGNLIRLFGIILTSMIFRVGSTMIVFKKHFKSPKYSAIFGFGLCTKFSTSIVILNFLLDNMYITPMIFSVIMTAFLTEKIITVLVYSLGLGAIAKEFQLEGNVCNIDDCLRPESKELKKI